MAGTLTGQFPKLNDEAAKGTVKIEAVDAATEARIAVIVDGAGNKVYTGSISLSLDSSGTFTAELPATDDTDLNPSGFVYKVTPKLNHSSSLRAVLVEVPDTETVDLADAYDLVVDPTSPTYSERVNEATAAAAAAASSEATASEAATTAATAASAALAARGGAEAAVVDALAAQAAAEASENLAEDHAAAAAAALEAAESEFVRVSQIGVALDDDGVPYYLPGPDFADALPILADDDGTPYVEIGA